MQFYKISSLFFLFHDLLQGPEVKECFHCLEPGSHLLQSALAVVLLEAFQLGYLFIQFPVLDGEISQVGDMHPGVFQPGKGFSDLLPVERNDGVHHFL